MILSDTDLRLICEGAHDRVYEKLGAHVVDSTGTSGTHFAVWAPSARAVSVIGDFNGWNASTHPLSPRGASGVWAAFVPGVGQGATYKYSIVSPDGNSRFDRADPYAFAAEVPPGNASKVWDPLRYEWGDEEWMKYRAARQSITAPISIYELHLGSWMRVPEDGNRPLSYREIAPKLADYASEMGFTHVELMPVAEHPALESWGYQVAGFFAPTGRYGTPQDLMFLVDTLHRRGIGVILDWVPGHFATDTHGLVEFDGTPLYEPADPRRRKLPVWNTYAFNYENPVVVNFLTANAPVLARQVPLRRPAGGRGRVDDPARLPAQGGRVGAQQVRRQREPRGHRVPQAGQPQGARAVSRHDHDRRGRVGPPQPDAARAIRRAGLRLQVGHGLGPRHARPVHAADRRNGDRRPTPSCSSACTTPSTRTTCCRCRTTTPANGNRSLLARMPGDDWEQRANLRLLYGYMFALPGKKLMFMGDEFGQWAGMVVSAQPRLALAERSPPSRPPAPGARPQHPVPGRAGSP